MSPEAVSTVLVVAGEASADAHGAKVLAQLRARMPQVHFYGLGGEKMLAAGLEPVADARVLGVVGITEALRGLVRIRRIYQSLLAETQRRQPAVALLMDLPDFNLRLAGKLKGLGVPVVYYLAPQVWAWRKGRIRPLRRRVARLCVVFPFEQDFFRQQGLPVEFVGHPLTEDKSISAEPDSNRIVLLPGSRPREIQRLLPAMIGAARIMLRERPALKFDLPLAPGLEADEVEEAILSSGVDVQILRQPVAQVLAGARLALSASGTVTLEAALADVPQVVIYRISKLSYALAKLLVRISRVCIVNILAGRDLVPELLQRRVRAELIAQEAQTLLADGPARERVLAGYQELKTLLGNQRPSTRVASILETYLGHSMARSQS